MTSMLQMLKRCVATTHVNELYDPTGVQIHDDAARPVKLVIVRTLSK